MKIIKYTSLFCLMSVCVVNNLFADNPPAPRPVYMTSQIQRLLNEKEEKMSKLEECDGKRKGFMIAGISTIGLTAVGVGVNIAQASKSNKLSNQIEDQNRQLEKQQANLANINSQISEIQSEKARRDCEAQEGKMYVNGRCVDKQQYEPHGINIDPNGQDNQQNNDQGDAALQYDGVIGEQCQDGAVWTKDDAGDKKCVASKDATETIACKCVGQGVRSPVQTNPDNSDPGNTSPNYASWRVTCDTYKFTFPAGPRVTEDERRLMDQCISEMKGTWTLIPGENPNVLEWSCENMKKCSETPPKVEPNYASWRVTCDTYKFTFPAGPRVTEDERRLMDQCISEMEGTWTQIPEKNPNVLEWSCENMEKCSKTPPKVEPIQANARRIDSIPVPELESTLPRPRDLSGSNSALVKPARITGYCRDEEGTGLTDEGDYCYCSAEWENPSCSENKLFADQAGVCVGDKNARKAACDRFCNGKVQEFGKQCSLDR